MRLALLSMVLFAAGSAHAEGAAPCDGATCVGLVDEILGRGPTAAEVPVVLEAARRVCEAKDRAACERVWSWVHVLSSGPTPKLNAAACRARIAPACEVLVRDEFGSDPDAARVALVGHLRPLCRARIDEACRILVRVLSDSRLPADRNVAFESQLTLDEVRCARNVPDSCLNLARSRNTLGERTKAAAAWRRALILYNKECQRWIQRDAPGVLSPETISLDNQSACVEVARLYARGNGVRRNLPRAMKLWDEGCDLMVTPAELEGTAMPPCLRPRPPVD